MIRPIMIFFALFVAGEAALSAEISVYEHKTGVALIFIEGDFVLGDELNFAKVAKPLKKAIVLLASPGGNLGAGMEIGRAISKRNFATSVVPNASCASSCALAWLAGRPRMLPLTSQVGFHAAFSRTNPENEAAANALIGAYLRDFGFGDGIIAYVMKTRPESMRWIKAADAIAAGLQIKVIDDADFNAIRPPGRNSTLDSSATEQTAVDIAGFYEEAGSISTREQVVWSTALDQLSATVELPSRGYQFIVSFNRSEGDIPRDIELRFTARPHTKDRIVSEVLYLSMKQEHDQIGSYLAGSLARMGDDYQIFSLSRIGAEAAKNRDLLELRWMDVVVKFGNGKRAILTIRRPVAFDDELARLFRK